MSDSDIQNVPNGLPFPRDKFPNNEVLVLFFIQLPLMCFCGFIGTLKLGEEELAQMAS